MKIRMCVDPKSITRFMPGISFDIEDRDVSADDEDGLDVDSSREERKRLDDKGDCEMVST